MAPGVVNTTRVARSSTFRSQRVCEDTEKGLPASTEPETGSRKSAIHGSPVTLLKVWAMQCAVMMGYVDQMAFICCWRINRNPFHTAATHQVDQRSGCARNPGYLPRIESCRCTSSPIALCTRQPAGIAVTLFSSTRGKAAEWADNTVGSQPSSGRYLTNPRVRR